MEPSRKRQRLSPELAKSPLTAGEEDAESTDFKLAILASLNSDKSEDVLLDYLLAYDGSVDAAGIALSAPAKNGQARKRNAMNGYQSSLSSFASSTNSVVNGNISPVKSLTKRGRTLHLYSPKDVEAHTPCSIIHNFLPSEQADALLQELLREMSTFKKTTFQMFDRAVESPHTTRLYVDTWDEAQEQKSQYMYNGDYTDIGKTPLEMLNVSMLVRKRVNEEIQRRMKNYQPGGKKLKCQSPSEWKPNASFVNCYDGGKESVGWHSDHLTYLGPRAIIGSLSLGVAREFRVRKIVPQVAASSADEQGQIAIHLPHNSLLVMHAEMQEEWKHSVAPTKSVDPHPIAGNRRFNITYRCYQDYLHPKFTPRCRCNVPAVLRCVQKRAATRGRYMWMCHAGFAVGGQKSCSWFVWAEFDQDGLPSWAEGYKGNANLPIASNDAAEIHGADVK